MTEYRKCNLGHFYIFYEFEEHRKGAPDCPICHVEWCEENNINPHLIGIHRAQRTMGEFNTGERRNKIEEAYQKKKSYEN